MREHTTRDDNGGQVCLLSHLPLCVRFCVFSYNKDMELEDAINTAILTLKEGFEGAITEENIEIAVVGADKKFRVLSEQEVKDYVKEVE